MSEKIATRQAYGEALAALGEIDARVVVCDADLSGSTKTNIFAKKFPDRFFNFGVAEQNLLGAAAGMAKAGKRPFVSTFAIFATGRAFEPLRQQIAYPALPVKVVASHGGITVGEDGGSHQTVEDLSLMRSLPNMAVIIPADATETRLAVTAMHALETPVYMRTGRMNVPVLFGSDYTFKVGKANLLRDGGDITLAACGIMVATALQAADDLAKQGIKARVLNFATIKPIDIEAVIAAATQTHGIVVAEEASIIGGLGSAICETAAEHAPCKVKRIGMPDVFGKSGKAEELLEHFGLTAAAIASAAQDILRTEKK